MAFQFLDSLYFTWFDIMVHTGLDLCVPLKFEKNSLIAIDCFDFCD